MEQIADETALQAFNAFAGIIAFIISIILVITFFVMAYRLKRIVDSLDDLR